MKSILLSCIISLFSYKSQAQHSLLANYAVPVSHSPVYITQDSNQQQWMQNETDRCWKRSKTGKVLTFSGIGLMAAGGILMATADKSGSFSSWDGQAIAGSVGLIAGALVATGGIILWSNGNKKSKKGSTAIQLQPGGTAALVHTF